MNVYDVRTYDVAPYCGMNWPFELENVTSYLGVSNDCQSMQSMFTIAVDSDKM